MKIFIISVFIVLSAHSTFAAHIINAGPDFSTTLAGWDKLSIDQQLTRWKEFESKYPYIYDSVIYRKQDSGWEDRQNKKRSVFFQQLPSIRTDMEIFFKAASQVIAEKETLFKTLFPDLPNNIPVYLLPSMSTFNGKVTELPEFGRTGLLMGVDFIVLRNDNLNVLFSHEFFHAYHEDKLPAGSTGATMATPLWKEGFATYVSGILNPSESDDVLLMDPELARECAKKEYVAEIAKLYLSVLKTDGENTYADWFLMSGPTKPVRRGYCLGLQVIREITKNNNLKNMTTWTEARFSIEILHALSELSK